MSVFSDLLVPIRGANKTILGHTRSSCCYSMVYKCDFICLPQLQLPPLLPHGIQVTASDEVTHAWNQICY